MDRARAEEEGHWDASQGPRGLQVRLGTTTLGSSMNLTFLGNPRFFSPSISRPSGSRWSEAMIWGCQADTHTHTHTHTHARNDTLAHPGDEIGPFSINLCKTSTFTDKILSPEWEFSDGPLAKSLCSQCTGSRFDPWPETISHMQQINKNIYFKKFSPQSIVEYESCSMVKNP